MTLQLLRNCNFGRTKSGALGSTGVGYQLLDITGTVIVSRTTSGVYQTAPGIYAAPVIFPDNFSGQILWDTGTYFSSTYYATEQYNVDENDQRIADIYSQTSFVSGSFSTISNSITTISGNIDALNAVTSQTAINSYASYVKLTQVSGSVEAIKNDVAFISGSTVNILNKFSNIEPILNKIYDIQFGRWHVIGNQMIYYKEDNVTEIARFSLLDDAGVPTEDAVFERIRI